MDHKGVAVDTFLLSWSKEDVFGHKTSVGEN